MEMPGPKPEFRVGGGCPIVVCDGEHAASVHLRAAMNQSLAAQRHAPGIALNVRPWRGTHAEAVLQQLHNGVLLSWLGCLLMFLTWLVTHAAAVLQGLQGLPAMVEAD